MTLNSLTLAAIAGIAIGTVAGSALNYVESHSVVANQSQSQLPIVEEYLELSSSEQLGVILSIHRQSKIPAEAAYEIAEEFCRTNWNTKRVCYNAANRRY